MCCCMCQGGEGLHIFIFLLTSFHWLMIQIYWSFSINCVIVTDEFRQSSFLLLFSFLSHSCWFFLLVGWLVGLFLVVLEIEYRTLVLKYVPRFCFVVFVLNLQYGFSKLLHCPGWALICNPLSQLTRVLGLQAFPDMIIFHVDFLFLLAKITNVLLCIIQHFYWSFTILIVVILNSL